MEYWAALPVFDPELTPEVIREIGVRAEALGFAGVVVGDHIAVARQHADRHGFGYEALCTLAYLAAATQRLRLGTSAIVAPLRHPVLLAKQVATLDVLSGGRVTLGLTAGYQPGEFTNLGADYSLRGARTEETIRLIRHLFSGSGAPFHGRFVALEDYVFAPLPAQGADLPILVGGWSDGALRRAATLGDLWQSASIAGEEFRERAATLRALAAQAGRSVQVGAEVRMGVVFGDDGAPPGARFIDGSADELRAQVRAWEALGAERLTIGFPARDFLATLERFAEAVAPAG